MNIGFHTFKFDTWGAMQMLKMTEACGTTRQHQKNLTEICMYIVILSFDIILDKIEKKYKKNK